MFATGFDSNLTVVPMGAATGAVFILAGVAAVAGTVTAESLVFVLPFRVGEISTSVGSPFFDAAFVES